MSSPFSISELMNVALALWGVIRFSLLTRLAKPSCCEFKEGPKVTPIRPFR